MSDDCLKLTAYLGERDRAGDAFLADALTAVYARHELRTSLLLRGAEGFGAGHRLHTDRLLSLSEDLPLVSVAVDARARIEAALADVARLPLRGLLTLEGARMLGDVVEAAELADDPGGATKLTVYAGRRERAERIPAHQAVVALLRRHGVAGATVLLGVDGTAHGLRRRATFFGRNADVPLMVIAVGAAPRIRAALPELGAMLARPVVTLERVRVCKRDGELLAPPLGRSGAGGPAGGGWQKLMVYAGEQSRHAGRPLHHELVRRLRASGAAGATTLRGIWGYHGDHEPHGDIFWQLRRRVPVVTVVVDRAVRIGEWFAIADELTSEGGLVTSEVLPSVRICDGSP